MANFLREIFSEGQYLSSKRVFGGITLVCCLFCIVYLTMTVGASVIVENLLQTAMIMAAGLLGISSVTAIWKRKGPALSVPPTEPEHESKQEENQNQTKAGQ